MKEKGIDKYANATTSKQKFCRYIILEKAKLRTYHFKQANQQKMHEKKRDRQECDCNMHYTNNKVIAKRILGKAKPLTFHFKKIHQTNHLRIQNGKITQTTSK